MSDPRCVVYIAPCGGGASPHAAQSAAVRRLLAYALLRPLSALSRPVLLPATALAPPAAPLPPETRGAHGKPYPDGIDTPAGRRHVSLSHGGGFVAVAVSDRPVGLDIQPPITPETADRVARRLHPDERAAFLSAPARVWTAKESVLKLTGDGLSRPLSSFVLTAKEDGWRTMLGGRPVTVRSWWVGGLSVAAAQWEEE